MIEGLGSQLGLSQRQLEPSASTLYWYGNTSSSSLWYALSYIESRQTVRKGDRVWQVPVHTLSSPHTAEITASLAVNALCSVVLIQLQ